MEIGRGKLRSPHLLEISPLTSQTSFRPIQSHSRMNANRMEIPNHPSTPPPTDSDLRIPTYLPTYLPPPARHTYPPTRFRRDGTFSSNSIVSSFAARSIHHPSPIIWKGILQKTLSRYRSGILHKKKKKKKKLCSHRRRNAIHVRRKRNAKSRLFTGSS